METTTIHLLRHGEVDNPEGVLYGRLPGYGLTPLGQEMAEVVADFLLDEGLAKEHTNVLLGHASQRGHIYILHTLRKEGTDLHMLRLQLLHHPLGTLPRLCLERFVVVDIRRNS